MDATMSPKSCIRDERNARKVLVKSWARFASQDQMKCTEETNLDGTPSYVELLTCLQIAADARKLPARAKWYKQGQIGKCGRRVFGLAQRRRRCPNPT
jgi:hypothetical protein